MVLHSFRCLLSLQPMPLHAINPPLAIPSLTSPPATHLCSETAARINAMDSHTANRIPRAESATPEGNNPCPIAQASGPEQFTVSPTGDLLSHASLNVGGPESKPNRMCHLLSGFPTLPHTPCLQEFKPTSAHHSKDYERVALHWNYHLVFDSPIPKNGVAILVHTSISPKPPPSQSTHTWHTRIHPTTPAPQPLHAACTHRAVLWATRNWGQTPLRAHHRFAPP